jgi:hypothetical protein
MHINRKKLKPEEVAAIVEQTPKTLANWRWKGIGPSYVKLGNVIRYYADDVEEYVRAHYVQTEQSVEAS